MSRVWGLGLYVCLVRVRLQSEASKVEYGAFAAHGIL